MKAGHEVIPVHPKHDSIDGIPVVPSLTKIHGKIDTLTVYIGPKNIGPLIPEIIALKPKRVILNPGAESPELSAALKTAGIPVIEACTLVMLRSDKF